MKSLGRIGKFLESRRMSRQGLKLKQEQRDAWEQYHRDTAAMHERFQEWESRKLIEAHMRRQAGLPEDPNICPDRLTWDDWLRENPHIVKPEEPERQAIVQI